MASTVIGKKDYFCLEDYDCIAFDMDHTMVQYHLPEIFKLIYKSIVDFLVKEKNYDESILHVDNFSKHEDFSVRGLVFDHEKGNFVKLDKNGYILSCSHGMCNMGDEDIIKVYGESRIWPLFPVLKEKVYHADNYTLMENFFLMPAAPIIAQLIEDADKRNVKNYSQIWKDIAAALSYNFSPKSFNDDDTLFFPSLRNDTTKYVKKCSASLIPWLKTLRSNGKTICLITDSYRDFTELLMTYSVGDDWKDLFDYIVAYANKPNFFLNEYKFREFLSGDDRFESTDTTEVPFEDIKSHTMYTRGHSQILFEILQEKTSKDNPKFVYFGDSIKSDIYPPHTFASWDTVAVLEELEAEEVHFHKNNVNVNSAKRPKLTPLLKEEKLLIASSQWGSFFAHHDNKMSNKNGHPINTFWGDLVQRCSKIAIPSLDYIAELPIGHKFTTFGHEQFGFYPSPPRSVLQDECEKDLEN